jgi:putative membrane protein
MYRSFARALAVVGVFALLTACGPKEDGQQSDAAPAVTDPVPVSDTTATVFVEKAGGGDMFEVQAAQLAVKRSRNPDVKAYAQMMIDAHTKSTNDLKAAIAASAMTLSPPATLPLDFQTKLATLNSTDASSFDDAYMGQQVEAHQQALDLIQRYATDGDTPAIKTFAAGLTPIVQDHLAKARDLQSRLGS